MPAIGVKADAARRRLVRRELLDDPTRLAVPNLDLAVLARGCDLLAIGTERHPINFGRVLQDQWLDLAQPHEVVPLPPAKVFRTVLECPQGGGHVVDRQFAVCYGDPLVIRLAPLPINGEALPLDRFG